MIHDWVPLQQIDTDPTPHTNRSNSCEEELISKDTNLCVATKFIFIVCFVYHCSWVAYWGLSRKLCELSLLAWHPPVCWLQRQLHHCVGLERHLTTNKLEIWQNLWKPMFRCFGLPFFGQTWYIGLDSDRFDGTDRNYICVILTILWLFDSFATMSVGYWHLDAEIKIMEVYGCIRMRDGCVWMHTDASGCISSTRY